MSLRRSNSRLPSSSCTSLKSSYITAPTKAPLSAIDDSDAFTESDYGVLISRHEYEGNGVVHEEGDFGIVEVPRTPVHAVPPPTPPSTVPSHRNTPDPDHADHPPRPSAPVPRRKPVPRTRAVPSIASTSYVCGESAYSTVSEQFDRILSLPLTPAQASRLPISCPPSATIIKGLPDNMIFGTKSYEFEFMIGEGNFGRVFHACRRDISGKKSGSNPKTVAIKVMNKVAVDRAQNWNYGEEVPTGREVQWAGCRVANRELVLKEMGILRQQSGDVRIPFLSCAYEVFQDSYFIYFVMPIGYQSLHDLMNQHRENKTKISRAELKRYAAELLIAIEGLHKLGWYHHDIKPDNIMLSSSGRIHLIDFGCAHRGFTENHGLRELMVSDMLGARACQTPELLRLRNHSQPGQPIFYRAELVDMWNYGLVLFEMIACPVRLTYPAPEGEYTACTRLMAKMPVDERSLLFEKLLCEDDNRRAGLQDVKAHPYFSGVDWDKVANKELPVEYVPGPCRPPDTLPPNLRVSKADMAQDAFYINNGIKFADSPASSSWA